MTKIASRAAKAAFCIACIGPFSANISSPTSAQGFFDKLDPCIAETKSFEDGRKKIRAVIRREMSTVNSSEPNDDYYDVWWSEKRKQLRKLYNGSALEKLIKDSGGNSEKGFVLWLAQQIEAAGGIDEVNKVMISDFRKMKKLELMKQSEATDAKLEQTRKDLYGVCKQDVLNQAVRVTINGALAPGNWIKENFKGAKSESGELAKVVRATVGISWKDIRANGICGGSNSEFRKLFGSLC